MTQRVAGEGRHRHRDAGQAADAGAVAPPGGGGDARAGQEAGDPALDAREHRVADVEPGHRRLDLGDVELADVLEVGDVVALRPEVREDRLPPQRRRARTRARRGELVHHPLDAVVHLGDAGDAAQERRDLPTDAGEAVEDRAEHARRALQRPVLPLGDLAPALHVAGGHVRCRRCGVLGRRGHVRDVTHRRSIRPHRRGDGRMSRRPSGWYRTSVSAASGRPSCTASACSRCCQASRCGA